MDKMREEFEAWFWNEFHRGSDITFYWDSVFAVSGNGEYCGVACNAYWTVWQAGWQASRAALCVNLPKQWFDDGLDSDLMEANRVLDALDAAGVRYK